MEGPCCNSILAGGKYELVEEIGRGGMGTVWRARAVVLDRPCAIKLLKPETAAQATNRERFVNEARVAARLRSPHTVTIFDVDFMDGVPFIAMELLSGESLERRLDRGVLTPLLTSRLIRQVALGLSAAHDAGLVHRDLKPDNIFLVQQNPLLVKILDFGVAKNIHASMGFHTVTGAIVGTPHYMSPEQAMGQPIDARCDLWSLGVLTFRCLTGRLPFEGDVWPEVLLKIVQGEIPPLASGEVALPGAVDLWWKRVMSRAPSGRPASALAFAEGLEDALGTSEECCAAHSLTASANRTHSERSSGERRRWAKRWFGWALGIGALCVLGLGAGAYAPGHPKREVAPPPFIAPQVAPIDRLALQTAAYDSQSRSIAPVLPVTSQVSVETAPNRPARESIRGEVKALTAVAHDETRKLARTGQNNVSVAVASRPASKHSPRDATMADKTVAVDKVPHGAAARRQGFDKSLGF